MFHSLCLTLPPTPASVPSSFRGAPPLVPMVWGVLECLGNQGRLGLPTRGGMERRGCTQTRQTRGMGEGLGGQGLGVNWGPRQLAGSGPGRGWDGWS